ncbi:MAG: serine/threonine protein kinase, partial [Myxococcales bacterium]|nr:serine/threonine protein kinase [Myxococcales bacterium]
MADRYCPLCDAGQVDAWCPVHRVPTLARDGARVPLEHIEVGTVLVGRYRIEGLLQQGGMGVLLAGHRVQDQRPVVVKVLKGQRVQDLGNVRRFYQEARAASALDHPRVVRILEFGVDEATRAPFLAMERIQGRTLKALINREGPLSEVRAARIFLQIAEGLAAAHAQGILHRDLKPSNVMITEGPGGAEQVKVLDFGLAKIIGGPDEVAPLTLPGKTVGTPAFMSPEQVTQRPQDFRADLYGLGCMLFATLVGTPPFVGDDLVTVMRMQMRAPTPPLPDVLADGQPPSEGLVRLYRRLLEKDPAHRPQSTREVADAFAALAGSPAGLEETEAQHEVRIPAPATLVEPVAATGEATDPSIETRRAQSALSTLLEPVETLPAPTRLGPNDLETPSGGRTLLSPAYGHDNTDDLVTPLMSADPADASDDILTTVQPQGLDDGEPDSGRHDEGPVLGVSLLAPNPAPPRAPSLPAATVPVEPAFRPPPVDRTRSISAVTDPPVVVGPARLPRPHHPSASDPADRAEPGRSQKLMVLVLAVAAVLVGLAAAGAFLRPSRGGGDVAPPAAAP